jgi:hypothetical protein
VWNRVVNVAGTSKRLRWMLARLIRKLAEIGEAQRRVAAARFHCARR